jgi:ATP-dependent Clp protease adaptor protein ClpS
MAGEVAAGPSVEGTMFVSTTARFSVNPEVLGAVVHAVQTAKRKTFDDAHMIAALARVGSVAQALAATGVDVPRLSASLDSLLAAQPSRPWYRFAIVTYEPLQGVATLAVAAGLEELSGPFAFASFAARSRNPELTRCLADGGFSLLRFRRQVAHGAVVDVDHAGEGAVCVVFHNDPFTTQEFVVEMLTKVFGRDDAAATTLMKQVHEGGHAELAGIDAAVARSMVVEARRRGDDAGFPLRLRIERADR